jgi:hypothetical protein
MLDGDSIRFPLLRTRGGGLGRGLFPGGFLQGTICPFYKHPRPKIHLPPGIPGYTLPTITFTEMK